MSSKFKLAPPYTLGRPGSGGTKFEPTSVKETNHLRFHFLFSFHCISPSVAGGGISAWQACSGWFRERGCASLCRRCRQHRTAFCSAVGKGGHSSVSTAAGRCPGMLWGMGTRGGDARARKKQKTQIDTTEAKLWKTNHKGYRRMS